MYQIRPYPRRTVATIVCSALATAFEVWRARRLRRRTAAELQEIRETYPAYLLRDIGLEPLGRVKPRPEHYDIR